MDKRRFKGTFFNSTPKKKSLLELFEWTMSYNSNKQKKTHLKPKQSGESFCTAVETV